MIPKIIHYCWFGNTPKDKKIKDFIENWKVLMPDYIFYEWNETNFKIDSIDYTKAAYKAKKYAFVSDYVRLWALYNYGGIYLDTDVEVIKNFDPLLSNTAFIGFESDTAICTAVIGTRPFSKFVSDFLAEYDSKEFNIKDLTPNPSVALKVLKRKIKDIKHENIIIQDYISIYTSDYFSVKRYLKKNYEITENTYSIHHFSSSWIPKHVQIKRQITQSVKKMFNYVSKKNI